MRQDRASNGGESTATQAQVKPPAAPTEIGSVQPSGPGQEDWMTFTFKLERLDGTPADPPSFKTTVLVWNPGDTIPLGPNRTLQVVRVRDEDADQPPVVVVADAA
jgi:hypothetical protein